MKSKDLKAAIKKGFHALLIAAFFMAGIPQSYAQTAGGSCLPGIPCVVGKTTSSGGIVVGSGGTSQNADKSSSDACDADFMNQIYARAFLEASRETIMSQTIIRKPDSVLELSCFDQAVKDSAEIAGALFTETQFFHGKRIRNPGSNSFLLSGIFSALSSAIDIANVFSSLSGNDFSLEGIGDVFGDMSTAEVGEFLEGLDAEKLQEFADKTLEAGEKALTDFHGDIVDQLESAQDAIGDLPNQVAGLAGDLEEFAGETLANAEKALNKAAEQVQGQIETAIDQGQKAIEGVMENATALAENAAKQVEESAQTLTSTLEEAGETVTKTAERVSEQAAGTLAQLENAGGSLPSAIGDRLASLSDSISDIEAPDVTSLASSLSDVSPDFSTITDLEFITAEEFDALVSEAQDTEIAAVIDSISPEIPTRDRIEQVVGNGFDQIKTTAQSAVSFVENAQSQVLTREEAFAEIAEIQTLIQEAPDGLSSSAAGREVLAGLDRLSGQVESLPSTAQVESIFADATSAVTELTQSINLPSADRVTGIANLPVSVPSINDFLPPVSTEDIENTVGAVTGIAGNLGDKLGAVAGDFENGLDFDGQNAVEAVQKELETVTAVSEATERVTKNLEGLQGELSEVTKEISSALELGDEVAPELYAKAAETIKAIANLPKPGEIAQRVLDGVVTAAEDIVTDKAIELVNSMELPKGMTLSADITLPGGAVLSAGLTLDANTIINGGAILDAGFTFPEGSSVPVQVLNALGIGLDSNSLKSLSSSSNDLVVDVYMGPDKLDKSLDKLVMKSLNEYLDENFDHSFLGGSTGRRDVAAVNNTIGAKIANVQAECNFMNRVYFLAKCSDFGFDAPFATFDRLTSFAPRLLPTSCTGANVITQDRIDVSRNKDFKYVSVDEMEVFEALTTSKTCAPPIRTGALVMPVRFNVDAAGNTNIISDPPFEEKVCPNPGCRFQGGNSCTR